jgi:aldose 1-epimerase
MKTGIHNSLPLPDTDISGTPVAENNKVQMNLFTIKNKNGLEGQITNYGGRIVNLYVPDKKGHTGDIVLGYDNLDSYLDSNEKFFGAIIGRYANRIEQAKFSIGGLNYKLSNNEGDNCLHGGNDGFHNVYWDVIQIDNQTIQLKYFSKDMEAGFPGNLQVKVIYCLTDENEFRIEYFASTDKPTFLSLTNHTFFNLTGNPNESVNNHILYIPASFYTPVDERLIPTGEVNSVKGTPFDFIKPTAIGKRVNDNHIQLILGRGYDHNWVLDQRAESNKEIRLAARISEPLSGRIMEVLTNEPGIQFYGGNFLNGTDIGKGKIPYGCRSAFCLETQHFPDSPNKENFPSTLLIPGEEYYSICVYRFGII